MNYLRTTPVSPRQQQVLDLMREIFGGEMEAEARNYRRIAARIGWKDCSGVRDCLYALRAKGAIRSTGASMTKPERWVAR